MAEGALACWWNTNGQWSDSSSSFTLPGLQLPQGPVTRTSLERAIISLIGLCNSCSGKQLYEDQAQEASAGQHTGSVASLGCVGGHFIMRHSFIESRTSWQSWFFCCLLTPASHWAAYIADRHHRYKSLKSWHQGLGVDEFHGSELHQDIPLWWWLPSALVDGMLIIPSACPHGVLEHLLKQIFVMEAAVTPQAAVHVGRHWYLTATLTSLTEMPCAFMPASWEQQWFCMVWLLIL